MIMSEFEAIPAKRLLASNLGAAGRAVVRACDSSSQELPVVISFEDRLALKADLDAIDEAQKIGLETGSRHFTELIGR